MRALLPSCVIAALTASCSIVPLRNEIASGVELAEGGTAVGTITSSGSETLSLQLRCDSPALIAYLIRDDLGRELERGEFRRGSHAFSWRPLDRQVIVELRASGAGQSRVEYQLSSPGQVGIAWDLTHALR